MPNLLVNATVDRGIYVTEAGATVEEGPYKGTAINLSLYRPTQVVYVYKDGKYLATVAFDLQSIGEAAIMAAEAYVKEHE